MTLKERFFATLERRPVDRPASWLGIPATAAMSQLPAHFQVADIAGLKQALGDDIWPVRGDLPGDYAVTSHEAILPDIAPENIRARFAAGHEETGR